ncbi:nucleoside phosphorylase domain-containing protein [Trichoderma pleuroticola]
MRHKNRYGISSAAGVAKDIMHSFPNIRVSLIVGIRGGAPSKKHNIRLGDIMVSAPRDGRGGVFHSQYKSNGYSLEEEIINILRKKPRLQKKYSRPDPSSNRLYQSRVVHPIDNDLSCVVSCDKDNLVIHYGVIASGNQLIKDTLIKNKLAAEEDILCFKMEAAGLINYFPCLVIYGICNYSNSHKNKEWQSYAAMAAAVYTKDLLY